MSGALRAVRAGLLWIATFLFFLVGGLLLVPWLVLVHPIRNDWPQRFFCRTILRTAGARLRIHFAPGFDPTRVVIFASNHVNVFDPYVLYSSLPQPFRGVELASHFRIPLYGWIARWHGNIPVPDSRERAALRTMTRRIHRALEEGSSLLVFPEGHRTRSGRVEAFETGIFRIISGTGFPIAPVSIVGSFRLHRTGHWMLRPGTIDVYLHDLIETRGVPRGQIEHLGERVRAVVSRPVEVSLGLAPEAEGLAGYSTVPSRRRVRLDPGAARS
jgi:1-acyl-sn-glycerol-3-phosphate acyltransferase